MERNERYEVDNLGQIVVGNPTTLTPTEKKIMIEKVFSRNGWNYELLSEETSAHFKIKLVNSNLKKEYTLNLYHGNVRKEDPERNREEKKIQLGTDNDPRNNVDDGIILGFYVYEDKTRIDNAIIVAWPIEKNKNYPANPSLRVNMRSDILPAKNQGFHIDKTTGKNVVAFRPEFIYYYLERYKQLHYSNSDEQLSEAIREDSGVYNDSEIQDVLEIKFNSGYQSNFERNRIIFGAPGTGKSYNLKKDCNTLINGTTGSHERVTFHPDYAYSHFVGTYKPVTDDNNSEIKYEFVPGPFMRVYVEALRSGRTGDPQPHLLLIEEINRAKVAAVFGDVFQLLDRDDDGVSEYEIQASEDVKKYLAKELGGNTENYTKIKIPDNMFIWATMNSADQGVFPMDTAFKRRWNFEYLGIDKNDGDIKGKIKLGTGSHELEVGWNHLRKAINEKLAEDCKVNEDKLMGPYFLSKKVIKTVSDTDNTIADPDNFKNAFKNKVIMYLYEDAAKQYKRRLFDGCNTAGFSTAKYSSVCDAFDEIGIAIFGENFKEFYDKQGV
ncbi:AAA family ATPase [Clostridium intestinale]|uniref:AAA domain (Dynein-related subfamily) n=1 Tax=Clostridium intestinale DSM 6191 TaxID=1121320 RepID=A0A1M5T128_9CLOT|nr:AAA family ATPase [Clostridium intestinale]SHH44491.1 AAA domain (dynein-related subfamily) [Clostridium intestinale DSM 6191]